MTIKDFSSLCGCSAQTLRYYDSIGLLKPVRVDPFTGYRHYDEEQAMAYVRIKNLQEAAFSISEIMELLPRSDDDVYAAIERKITEQEEKLSRMRKIQASYRSEAMKMKMTIDSIREAIARTSRCVDPMTEYGLTEEAYDAIIAHTGDCIVPALEVFSPLLDQFELPNADAGLFDIQTDETGPDPLKDPDNEVAAECSGWEHVKDALDALPPLDGPGILYFQMKRGRRLTPVLPNVVLAIMADRCAGQGFTLSCTCVQTNLDENRLYLLRKRGV